jgi:uncharacterized membrane protein
LPFGGLKRMVDVFTEIEIMCTAEKVSAFASDPDNAPEWYVNIHSAEWMTAKSLTIGSQIAFKAKFLRRELSYVYEIAEFIPGERMVMRTADGPFPMKTIYTWQAADQHTTRMTLQNIGNPTGFSKWFAPFMSIMMKRANTKDLKKLKNILENR